jgi:hypothetical protein
MVVVETSGGVPFDMAITRETHLESGNRKNSDVARTIRLNR